MNRRWPKAAAWALLAATVAAVIAGARSEAMHPAIAILAAATAIASLCQRRHWQHGLTAAVVMALVLAAGFLPVTRAAKQWPGPLLALGLLVGSRGVLQAVTRHQARAGLIVTLGGSGVFAASLLVGAGWQDVVASGWARWAWLSGLSLLAQLAATPWLVKTIPESREDARVPVALWAMLIVGPVLATARQDSAPSRSSGNRAQITVLSGTMPFLGMMTMPSRM
jgi:hypothetical protein